MNLSLLSLFASNPQVQTAAALNAITKFSSTNPTNSLGPHLFSSQAGTQGNSSNTPEVPTQNQSINSIKVKDEHPQDLTDTKVKVKVEAESLERSLANNLAGGLPIANISTAPTKLTDFDPLVQRSSLMALYSGLAASKMLSVKMNNSNLGNRIPNISVIPNNQLLFAQLLQNNLSSLSKLQGTTFKYEIMMNGANRDTTQASLDIKTAADPQTSNRIPKTEKPKSNPNKKVKQDSQKIGKSSKEENKSESGKIQQGENSEESIANESAEETEEEEDEEDSKEDLFKPTKHCYYVTKKPSRIRKFCLNELLLGPHRVLRLIL